MFKLNNQSGFSAVEILFALVFVGIIGFAGYFVYNNSKEDSNTTSSEVVSTEGEQIKDEQDLQEAEEALNTEDLDSLDTLEFEEAENELL